MNKVKPEVKIMLDRERTLVLDLNSMVSYEEVTGKNLFNEGFESVNASAKDMRVMLWACLLHDDPSLTLEQVGSIISIDNMSKVASRLNEAFEVAVPKTKRKSASPLPKNSTG